MSGADEQAVRASLVDWYAAIERHDMDAVAAALAPGFLIVEHDRIMDAPSLVGELTAGIDAGRQTAELSEFDIVIDGDIAWCTLRNEEVWHPTEGAPTELEFLETVILRRHEQTWRLQRYHASRLRPTTLDLATPDTRPTSAEG